MKVKTIDTIKYGFDDFTTTMTASVLKWDQLVTTLVPEKISVAEAEELHQFFYRYLKFIGKMDEFHDTDMEELKDTILEDDLGMTKEEIIASLGLTLGYAVFEYSSKIMTEEAKEIVETFISNLGSYILSKLEMTGKAEEVTKTVQELGTEYAVLVARFYKGELETEIPDLDVLIAFYGLPKEFLDANGEDILKVFAAGYYIAKIHKERNPKTAEEMEVVQDMIQKAADDVADIWKIENTMMDHVNEEEFISDNVSNYSYSAAIMFGFVAAQMKAKQDIKPADALSTVTAILVNTMAEQAGIEADSSEYMTILDIVGKAGVSFGDFYYKYHQIDSTAEPEAEESEQPEQRVIEVEIDHESFISAMGLIMAEAGIALEEEAIKEGSDGLIGLSGALYHYSQLCEMTIGELLSAVHEKRRFWKAVIRKHNLNLSDVQKEFVYDREERTASNVSVEVIHEGRFDA